MASKYFKAGLATMQTVNLTATGVTSAAIGMGQGGALHVAGSSFANSAFAF
jgi:hypothetical protein